MTFLNMLYYYFFEMLYYVFSFQILYYDYNIFQGILYSLYFQYSFCL